MGDSLSVWAIWISVAAAGFTGWQTLMTHQDRVSRRAARLYVIGLPTQGDDEGPRWMIENIGQGPAVDVRVAARVVASPVRDEGTEFQGKVVGSVAGGLSVPIEPIGRTWPAALNEYRDHPGVRVWAGGRARVEWTDIRGKKRSKDIAVSLPD